MTTFIQTMEKKESRWGPKRAHENICIHLLTMCSASLDRASATFLTYVVYSIPKGKDYSSLTKVGK